MACDQCGAVCIDTSIGYVTGCEHYPPDCRCHRPGGRKRQPAVGKCALCAMRERLAGGESLRDLMNEHEIE